jgi:predicted PhzF superfamily epimerase YddE/YHI9
VSWPLYQVDAFTAARFAGNPAAVCLLEGGEDEGWMQAVAAEMNLSETAFLRPGAEPGSWGLRWFTPAAPADPPDGLLDALGGGPAGFVGLGRFEYLVELAGEAAVLGLAPDVRRLDGLGTRGVIVTAAADAGPGSGLPARGPGPGPPRG